MRKALLLIDDDLDDYEIIRGSLLQIGVSTPILFERSGMDALNYLKKNVNNLPVLIILDVNLPQINGFEILEEIKNNKYNIPVIMYTTSCTDEIVKRAKNLGA